MPREAVVSPAKCPVFKLVVTTVHLRGHRCGLVWIKVNEGHGFEFCLNN